KDSCEYCWDKYKQSKKDFKRKIKLVMSISDETLNKIKSDKIEQKPRWQFYILNVSKWVAIVSTTIVAALIFAIVIEYLSSLDLDLYSQSRSLILNYFVSNIPAILIILLVI
ncbi:MAG TPA: hypothetical protein PKI46_07255, partial [Bacteroidales bacterium]|nr:hypothetical protein [Bacteroidales bacterium]